MTCTSWCACHCLDDQKTSTMLSISLPAAVWEVGLGRKPGMVSHGWLDVAML